MDADSHPMNSIQLSSGFLSSHLLVPAPCGPPDLVSLSKSLQPVEGLFSFLLEFGFSHLAGSLGLSLSLTWATLRPMVSKACWGR